MDKPLGPRKIVRAPALRRGREIIPISDRVKLERVLGFTLSNNAAFDCDPHSSIIAYPAGCVVVLYNVRKNKQHHILSSSKKTITSLAFSGDGKYLATGECGHQPHVRVWDVHEKNQIAEFQGHKYGINCVAFSPNLKYVVSVGSQHDMIVNVWDWRNNVKVASNKVSCKVKAISFAVSGNYFVTVGNRHVKFWYLEYSRSAKHKLEPVPLMGRSAILGDQRNNNFCDVACGKGDMCDSTYAITKSGLLCEFNSRRLLDKWVELRTTSANSISVRDQYIFIGCASGVIRCFSPFDLNFICTLPKPHYLGIDVAQGIIGSKPVSSHPSNVKYPDTVAIALDENNKKVTCIYNDHSLYVWDIKDMKKIGKSHSFFYHSACIWGIETYPDMPAESEHVIPKGTFLTCSSDDTIRFWNLDSNVPQDAIYHRNIFSSELLKILYIDPELSYLCDMDSTPSGSNDKTDTTYDGKNGVRCLRISPNGRHLASGDRSGNIRIYDLEFIDEVCKIEAHDSEVLCLEYSKPVTVNGEDKKYLASASRDRLIHVFDVKQDYSFQETLDDHSSSITAVRFVHSSGLLQMISCGADKSIIFRKAQFNPHLSFAREHHVVGKTTLYDMEVDIHQKHILTACQDRNIRVYSVLNGKQIRYFRGSQGEDGTLIKVTLDPSGTYLATSCTDKSLYIYDYTGGECLATMFGHSELVTGLKFTDDGQHLISVSGDGCIFVWRLPMEVTQNIVSKACITDGSLPNLWQDGRKNLVGITKPVQLLENNALKSPISTDLVNGNNLVNSECPPGYRFSMGQLPLWAKKQMLEELSATATNPQLAPPVPPRGRWAQRIDGQGLVMRSYLDSDSVIQYPNISKELENSTGCQNTEKIDKAKQNESAKLEGEDIHFEISPHSFQEILTENMHEASNGTVTVRRDTDDYSNNKKLENVQVNNSMVSMKVEDMDAEDERSDSEISETVYYPISEDGSDKGDGNFHVCANSEDLKSQKVAISAKQERHNNVSVISTPEQVETNSDDDEASTPIESDKSFLSSLCVSTENLERLGQREKFMRSNYESLEKDETSDLDFDERSFCRQSISAKFLSGSLAVAKRLITSSPIRSAFSDGQVFMPTSKREKLNKALNETKKKLETVGFRTGLSNSKSIGDIRNMHDKDSYRTSKFGVLDNDIRRATSMTDLSTIACPRRLFSVPHVSQSEKENNESAPLWNQCRTTQDNSPTSWNSSNVQAGMQKSTQQASSNASVSMSRSISMSSLHSKHRTSTPSIHKTPSIYSLARTSVIKQDSESPVLGKSFCNSLSSPLRRNNLPSLPPCTRPLNIITTSTLATDSSSDSSPTESMAKSFPNIQNSVQRPRFLNTSESIDRKQLQQSKQKSHSEWDLKNSSNICNVNKHSWSSSSQMNFDKLNLESHSEEHKDNLLNSASLLVDPASVPLSIELCESVSENLKRTASYVVEIYERVALSGDISVEDKYHMTNVLAESVWQVQKTLRPTSFPMPLTATPLDTESQLFGPRRLPGLGLLPNGNHSESSLHRFSSETQLSQPDVIDTMTLLQQFSDKLLSIVEQQISAKHQQKPNE